MKTWLKGGIIGIILLIVFLIILDSSTCNQMAYDSSECSMGTFYLGFFLAIPVFLISSLVGTIIGLIIGKFKNKKGVKKK